MRSLVLDGGLATALQPLGLPVATPVDDWILARPGLVEAAQARFAAAGADLLLAGTFRALPHLRADWAGIADAAVAIARRAALAHGSESPAEVWASIGPASTPTSRWAAAGPAQAGLTRGWAALARRCAAAGATGFALETFVEPAECAAAVGAVREAAPGLPIAACLTPGPDGRLLDGAHPGPALAALRRAGAAHVGFNCGFGPASIEAAVALAPEADWAKPSRGDLAPEAVVAALVRLADRCAYVGGCCGVTPAEIAGLRASIRA